MQPPLIAPQPEAFEQGAPGVVEFDPWCLAEGDLVGGAPPSVIAIVSVSSARAVRNSSSAGSEIV